MNQTFTGAVDQVAARDINNYHQPGRALTKVERSALNRLVRKLEDEHREPGWKTWRFLHRTIGVDSVDSMTIEHRDIAEELLNLQIRCAELQAMVGEPPPAPVPMAVAPVADTCKLDEDLRRTQRMLNRIMRQADTEKAMFDSTAAELASVRRDFARVAPMFTKACDELLVVKREKWEQGKALKRQRVVTAVLSCALIAVIFLQ